jgi:Yip1-like protein
MSESFAPPPAQAEEVGAIARIPGVIFSPGKTFESIARRPTWLAPLLLWTAMSVVVTSVLLPKIDYNRMIRASFEKRGQTIPEERLQSIVQTQKRIAPVLYTGIAAVAPAAIALLVALVYWAAFKAFGWDMKFAQAFGVTTHAFVPSILGSILILPVLARRESVDPQTMGDLLRSNLGFLVDQESSKMLHSLLQSLDLFSFWCLALLAIGFAAAAKVSRASAAGIVLTLWLLYVLGKAGLAAVF